jgi:hypothetical protein
MPVWARSSLRPRDRASPLIHICYSQAGRDVIELSQAEWPAASIAAKREDHRKKR